MLQVTRKNVRINPDLKKVIPRFFNTGNERALMIVEKVSRMTEEVAGALLNQVLQEFCCRYKDIELIFEAHFERVCPLLSDGMQLSREKRFLIGAYFTMEYSIEAAALFNPSVVEAPDQSGLAEGEKRMVISLRATGESHISSITFREGILDKDCNIRMIEPDKFIEEGLITEERLNNKKKFEQQLTQLRLPEDIHSTIIHQLTDEFTYEEMDVVLRNSLIDIERTAEREMLKRSVMKLVDATYELHFPEDSSLSERVIFPVSFTEKNGIEDARFVRFTEDDGSVIYYATYTAYDGVFILPKLIETTDFCHFKISPLYGKAAVNKNLALFPRRINGKYAMLSRIDGVNNYIMFSDDLHLWEEATLLQAPVYPWEFVQIGNGGSPILTEKGWLVITHGVGPMRKYSLGASLFDLDNPLKEIGRLGKPLLMPNEDERNGYVPNVVYSCGACVHAGQLFLPYAVSDYASSFATIPLNELLDEILRSTL
ncbi:glycoside hydrolase family 130 protein [Chitinophaga tropicalis]|uniref:Glycosidase n=1 Tax=Chitinophaga tropicalis TaxID=2683588 RepID=A0A7K1U3U7_9BACT|nr:glycoside hydrolase family 130 protein [Chitinophaga tropicalis]MVT09034.1 glycosidase [Chitinophaga tropicalis]